MQRLAIRILCIALIAIYGGVSSATAVQTKRPDGGFTPRLDKLQGLLDYIHTAEKIEVKAGPTLWQAVGAIPIAAGVLIVPEQEADLRTWLYDFLVAFSVSGNDSLAAQFYLREGVNNPTALKHLKETLEHWGVRKGDTPFDLFQAMHRAILDEQGCEYRFGHAFLRHSTFEVFEMQGRYEHYRSHRQGVVKSKFKLQREVEAYLAEHPEAADDLEAVRTVLELSTDIGTAEPPPALFAAARANALKAVHAEERTHKTQRTSFWQRLPRPVYLVGVSGRAGRGGVGSALAGDHFCVGRSGRRSA